MGNRSIAAVTALALAWLVTPAPAVAQNAYITNQGVYPNFSNSVTVIDTTTNKVVTTIDVGLAPVGVAVTPDGSTVYVTNLNNTVSVIAAATNAVSATISVGHGPSASHLRRTAARPRSRMNLTIPYPSSIRRVIPWSRRSASGLLQ